MAKIKLLTFNVKMLPDYPSGEGVQEKETRAIKIMEALQEHDYDIICLQEVFDEDIRKIFETKLKKNYPYQVCKCDDGDFFHEDSGLYFASKYPLRSTKVQGRGWDFIEFEDCAGWDCWADKGLFAARIELGNSKKQRALYLFHTHLQSDVDKKEPRASQLRQIRKCVAKALHRSKTSENDVVLLCGDMNVIGDNHPEYGGEEYKFMWSTLGCPRDLFREKKPTNNGYTWDYKTNNNMINLIDPYDKDQLRLDYIFAYDYFQIDQNQVQNFFPVHCTSANVQMFNTNPNSRLSDHYGVEVTLNI